MIATLLFGAALAAEPPELRPLTRHENAQLAWTAGAYASATLITTGAFVAWYGGNADQNSTESGGGAAIISGALLAVPTFPLALASTRRGSKRVGAHYTRFWRPVAIGVPLGCGLVYAGSVLGSGFDSGVGVPLLTTASFLVPIAATAQLGENLRVADLQVAVVPMREGVGLVIAREFP